MNLNKQQKYLSFIFEQGDRDSNLFTYILTKKPKWYDIKQILFRKYLFRFLRTYYSPSYEILCDMYDTIIRLENIYGYPNDEHHFRAFHNLKNCKSFSVPCTSKYMDSNELYTYEINYTMYYDRKINITIKRSWGDRVKTVITFMAGEPMLLSVDDQYLFDMIITNTMKSFMDVFEYYYFNTQSIIIREESDSDSFEHM